MKFFPRLRRAVLWHFIDVKARLGIGDEKILRQGRRPAYGRAQPKLLTVALGDRSFDPHDALHGSYSSPEHCSGVPDALWVEVGDFGECIRYYSAGLDSANNPLALLFFSGDIVLTTARGVRFISKSYAQQTPDRLTELMHEWAADAGAPAIYIGRPGIFGSSGEHEKRRLPYEIELMNRSVKLLKERHRIEQFILVGQSGGAQIAAALLNRRQDIAAAVLTSGLLSVHQTVRRWRRVKPVPGGAIYPVGALYDPMNEVNLIRRDPEPTIILISDPRDAVMRLHSQLAYLRKLQAEGLHPSHIYAHGQGLKRHSLGAHGRKAAALLARGKTLHEIRHALVELDMANLGHPQQMERGAVTAAAEV